MRWRLRHRREQHLDSPPEPVVRSSDPAARGARARRSGAGHPPSHRFERAAAARQWNASAIEGGRIVIVAPGRRPAQDATRR